MGNTGPGGPGEDPRQPVPVLLPTPTRPSLLPSLPPSSHSSPPAPHSPTTCEHTCTLTRGVSSQQPDLGDLGSQRNIAKWSLTIKNPCVPGDSHWTRPPGRPLGTPPRPGWPIGGLQVNYGSFNPSFHSFLHSWVQRVCAKPLLCARSQGGIKLPPLLPPRAHRPGRGRLQTLTGSNDTD